MNIGILILQVQLPGCKSLKEKRSRLKPLITRLHREFNVSVAEMDKQDKWDGATIGCALISNQNVYTQSSLQTIVHWLNRNWHDIILVDDHIEIIN
ncbi:MAG: hypothetical protein A2032_07305 [Chloroflexi bacterium RBG_19FT_COMBO_49_13]|nr:MAG: hypothetical protein A2032_07305 [Chloroflexi bacterium RBG_19FT_COMBO_49_13]